MSDAGTGARVEALREGLASLARIHHADVSARHLAPCATYAFEECPGIDCESARRLLALPEPQGPAQDIGREYEGDGGW